MTDKPKDGRGGARPGAGRKAIRGETTVMRIPMAYQGTIRELIRHLDETDEIDNNYQPVESEPVFHRSLKGKPQHITFKTSGIDNVTKSKGK